MKPLPQNNPWWTLDYGWAQRGGKWSEFTDVMLVAQAQDACGAQALLEWVAQQKHDSAQVDGKPCTIFYAGGVQGYLDETAQASPATRTLYLHSRGEDAFDSLSYYSEKIAKFVQKRGCSQPLVWTEARHDREDHQLQWP